MCHPAKGCGPQAALPFLSLQPYFSVNNFCTLMVIQSRFTTAANLATRRGPFAKKMAVSKCRSCGRRRGQFDSCLVLGGVRRTGCGGRVPRLAHSQNWALESANASRRANFSAFSVNTGYFDTYLVLGDERRMGYGGRVSRLAHS